MTTTLSKDVTSAHTLWVERPGRPPAKVRIATSGDHLVCFGDDGLSAVGSGERVTASVHRIAYGAPLETFTATVREVDGDDVDREALLELLAHVPLGRTLEEVEATLAAERKNRRILEVTL